MLICLLLIIMFRECPDISYYWVDVVPEIGSTITSELDFNFSVVYLGDVPTGLKRRTDFIRKTKSR